MRNFNRFASRLDDSWRRPFVLDERVDNIRQQRRQTERSWLGRRCRRLNQPDSCVCGWSAAVSRCMNCISMLLSSSRRILIFTAASNWGLNCLPHHNIMNIIGTTLRFACTRACTVFTVRRPRSHNPSHQRIRHEPVGHRSLQSDFCGNAFAVNAP